MNMSYPNFIFQKRFFSVITCLLIFFLTGTSNQVSAQSNVRINLSLKNTDLKTVLKEIKAQTQLDFVYNAQEISDKTRIPLIVIENAGIQTALESCLEPLGIDFVIQDKIIVLQKRYSKPIQEQQARTLKGIVVDKSHQPLPGVSVVLKGTTLGISTDVQGRFTLTIPFSKEVPELVFSFIGMQTKNYKVLDNKEINITLQESTEALDEVIVTGMEVIKKDRMTGSATVITAKDLQMQGVTSLDRILDGRIAGLNSTTLSGAPGVRSQITIRGENNLNGNTEPLWIVDGLPLMSGVPKNNTGDYAGTIMQDGVGNIMPEDIESISILKDASAAAIYGARAANGVIVITTKKGFRSKTQINYSGTYNVGIAPRNRLDFMNSEEKLGYEHSIVENFGLDKAQYAGRGGYLYKKSAQGYITSADYERQLQQLRRTNTNWFNVLFRTAHSQSHNISLRGGSEELTYYTSINYQQQNGILRQNQYQNAGALVKLEYRPIENLIFALNISANSRKNEDNASAINPFKYAVFANPYEKPYNDDGSYAPDLSYLPNNYSTLTTSGYQYDQFNILREIKENRSTQTGLDAELTFNIQYEVFPGLNLQSIIRKGLSYNTDLQSVNAGTYTSWANEKLARDVFKNGPLPNEYDNGELSESSGRNLYWSIRNQIDYSYTLKEKHLFSIMLANEVMSKKFNNFGYTSPIYYDDYRITGVPSFDVPVEYNDLKEHLNQLFNTSDGQDRSVSFLGTLRYSFEDRYVFNFTYRADGADMIGNANRFAPLWSVGLRYNLHKEKFFKSRFINELSLRGSFGYTGNIDRSAYPFSMMGVGNNLYMGNRYVKTLDFPNPDIRWEKKRDQNLGIDLTLFDNRINFTADYYFNRSTDILENLEVPASTGRTLVKANGGIVENTGVELYLNVKWLNTPDFTFSTSVNLSRNKNVIKKSRYAYSSYQEIIDTERSKGGVLNIIGSETGSIYGWKSAGVNPVTGNPRYYMTEAGKAGYAALLDSWENLPEEQKNLYKDMITSFDHIPDVADFFRDQWIQPGCMLPSMQYLGRTNPKYIGGFSTYMRYKGIEFSTNWTFKTGHLIPNFNDYQNAPYSGSDLGASSTNREKRYLYYWKAQGDVTDIPRFVSSPNNDYWASLVTSDKYSSGNYLRMTNLSLSYRLPQDIVKSLGLNSVLFGFNARNLLTFTKYRGLDVGSEGAFTYPVSREFNFKLTIGI